MQVVNSRIYYVTITVMSPECLCNEKKGNCCKIDFLNSILLNVIIFFINEKIKIDFNEPVIVIQCL